MKFILIDDDRDDIDIFKYAIEEMSDGIEFKGYVNFEKALDDLLNENCLLPDYIFLDGFMNTVNGKDCLLKFKENKVTAHIPVIIYSGFVNESNKLALMNSGAFNVFIKSNTIEGLKEYLFSLFPSNEITEQIHD